MGKLPFTALKSRRNTPSIAMASKSFEKAAIAIDGFL